MTEPTRSLRSESWYNDTGVNGFLQRSALKVQGLREKDYRRPVIGIANNTSDFNRCHTHFDGMVTAVKESVLAAGGRPREFNSITMGADLAFPLGMTFMHRNLLAMEVEQTAALHGLDGLVMLAACDETVPGHADGRGVDRPPRGADSGRPVVQRLLARQGGRIGLRLPPRVRGARPG